MAVVICLFKKKKQMELCDLIIGKTNIINVKNYLVGRRTLVINADRPNTKLIKDLNDCVRMLEQSAIIINAMDIENTKIKKEFFKANRDNEELIMENMELSRINELVIKTKL